MDSLCGSTSFYLGIFLLSLSANLSAQPENDSNPFDYKWLNKRLPLDTLVSYEGDTLKLFESTDSSIYVISFWYTNCQPCIAEIEALNELKRKYSSTNIRFIAISFDTKEQVDELLKSHPFEFEQFYLSQQQINENGLAIGYPTNLIVKADGTVFFQKSGGSAEYEKAQKIFSILSNEIDRLNNSTD